MRNCFTSNCGCGLNPQQFSVVYSAVIALLLMEALKGRDLGYIGNVILNVGQFLETADDAKEACCTSTCNRQNFIYPDYNV